jgi:hypothetical protein
MVTKREKHRRKMFFPRILSHGINAAKSVAFRMSGLAWRLVNFRPKYFLCKSHIPA